jgi:biopolymer transport protein ExbD
MIFPEKRKLGTRRYTTRLKMYSGWPVMIALVDIFFLLLWFFAQSGSYTRLSGIRVELPKAKAPTVADIHQYVISIMPVRAFPGQWSVYFRNRSVELSQLQEELTKLPSKPAPLVAIMADRRAPYEIVAQVLAMVGNVGISCFLPVMPAENPQKLRYEK